MKSLDKLEEVSKAASKVAKRLEDLSRAEVIKRLSLLHGCMPGKTS